MDTFPVYTHLHAATALQIVQAVALDAELQDYCIDLPAHKRRLTFSHKNWAMLLKYNHFLLIEGLTFTGGMNRNIQEIPIDARTIDSKRSVPPSRVIKANIDSVPAQREVDLTFYDYMVRRKDENEDACVVSQTIKLHLFAVPKGGERFIFLTFNDRSLRHVFKLVRSSPKELCIETVNSY